MRFCTGVFYLDKPKNNANIFLLKVWYVIMKKYAKICNLQMEETSMRKSVWWWYQTVRAGWTKG